MSIDALDQAETSSQTRWISVLIGVLAVILAICSMGGDNAAKDAARRNLDASNNWAFFQAKNIRRNDISLAADELEILLATSSGLTAEARGRIEAKAAEYRATAARLTSEPEKGDGLDELYKKGKALEAERDMALRQDPFFDWAQALLQIAIVLASVSIVAGSRPLVWMAGALGIAGALLTFNGFTMIVGGSAQLLDTPAAERLMLRSHVGL